MKIRISLIFIIASIVLLPGNLASSTALVSSNSATTSLGIALGVYQPPTNDYGTELNSFNALVGKTHGIVQYYVDWSTHSTGSCRIRSIIKWLRQTGQ